MGASIATFDEHIAVSPADVGEQEVGEWAVATSK